MTDPQAKDRSPFIDLTRPPKADEIFHLLDSYELKKNEMLWLVYQILLALIQTLPRESQTIVLYAFIETMRHELAIRP